MTETLVLVFDDSAPELVDLAEHLSSVGEIHQDLAVLTVRQGDDYCYVVKVFDLEGDGVFEDWPPAAIPQGQSAVFSLDYRSPRLAVEIAHLLASWRALKIDTNYGQIVAGAQLRMDMLQNS